MRLKTLTAVSMLAFLGFAGSATHADSLGLGVQTQGSTSADTQAGNNTLGASSKVEIGVKAGVEGTTRDRSEPSQQGELRADTHAENRTSAEIDTEHRGEAGIEGALESSTQARHNTAAEASGRSQSVLEGVSSTLETTRETGEQWRDEALDASGRTTGNLGAAATAEGTASTSGEVR